MGTVPPGERVSPACDLGSLNQTASREKTLQPDVVDRLCYRLEHPTPPRLSPLHGKALSSMLTDTRSFPLDRGSVVHSPGGLSSLPGAVVRTCSSAASWEIRRLRSSLEQPEALFRRPPFSHSAPKERVTWARNLYPRQRRSTHMAPLHRALLHCPPSSPDSVKPALAPVAESVQTTRDVYGS